LALRLLAGFCLSAASLEQGALPLVMGLVWACRGLDAVLAAAGGCLGYWVFWGQAGQQGLWYTGLALVGVLLLGDRRISRELPLLIPSIGMLTVSAVGLGYQILAGDTTSVLLHLLRVALGGAAPWLFWTARQRRDPVAEWLSWGLVTLALAQIAPVSWLGLGFVAAGVMSVWGAFPCAAVTGLALDIAHVTAVPMTAVTVLAWLVRFFPRLPRYARCVAPAVMGLALLRFCGRWDGAVLPGLLLGGCLGGFAWTPEKQTGRRGETGVAQVRLEVAASVLTGIRQLLEEVPDTPVDVDGLLCRAAENACAGCSARGGCRDVRRIAQLPGSLLYKPLLSTEELPVRCKKSGRFLNQLHHSQEQLRAIRADRERQREYRAAVAQQYRFLSGYLHSLSDTLARRESCVRPAFDAAVSIYGNRSRDTNADRCGYFYGTGGKYYIILCDGMGTGMGAVREGKTALDLLRKMLTCGFPAEHALQSLNSLCALGERAGAVTVDLAEISLDSGKTTVYKWGAAASYLVSAGGTEKLGCPGVPPGLSASQGQQVSCRLRLGREQILLLTSDGLVEEEVLAICRQRRWRTAEELARELLERAQQGDQDDATVVTVQLFPTKS